MLSGETVAPSKPTRTASIPLALLVFAGIVTPVTLHPVDALAQSPQSQRRASNAGDQRGGRRR